MGVGGVLKVDFFLMGVIVRFKKSWRLAGCARLEQSLAYRHHFTARHIDGEEAGLCLQ